MKTFITALTLTLLIIVGVSAQQSLTCGNGGTFTTGIGGVIFTCNAPPPPITSLPVVEEFIASPSVVSVGQSTQLRWRVTGNPTPTITFNQGIAFKSSDPTGIYVWSPTVTGSRRVTLTATNSEGVVRRTVTVTVNAAEPPPPPETGRKIWGIVDMAPDINGRTLLGNCSAEIHDQYVLPGPNNDGWYYRTWHPQVDPSGCVFGHEHGDNPASMRDSEVLARFDARFGLAAHNHKDMPGEPDGHLEAHEGYKVFVANLGDRNNDGFTNRMPTIAYNHMGGFRPGRFTQQHHSHSISWRYDSDRSFYANYHLLADTGGTGRVCNPRTPAPVKDVIGIDSPCRIQSSYEIWGMVARITMNGEQIYRGFATPAIFDPVTAFNPANPSEIVYVWDPRVTAIRQFSTPSWEGARACSREAYAQSGYFYNTTGQEEFFLDSMGNVQAQSGPLTLPARIARKSAVPGPFASEITQFKKVTDFCQNSGMLSLKN